MLLYKMEGKESGRVNKFIQNTIIIVALIILVTVICLNVIFTANISDDAYEVVKIEINTISRIGITALIAIGICIVCTKVNKLQLDKRMQIIIFAVLMIIYLIGQCWWLRKIQATPVADQRSVYNAAFSMHQNNWEELSTSQYLELYPQQLTLAYMYSFVFNLFGTSVQMLQCLNVVANIFTVLAIGLITKQLSKQYKVNLVKTVILSMTFISLPLLSIFIYGDFISMPMNLFAVYYIMKYSMENKKKYALFSAMFMGMAYILRMNNLIYILAIIVYMILDLLELTEKKAKEVLEKVIILLLFIAISILPATIMKTMLQAKLGYSKDKIFPTTGFIYMGMEESKRANGWYNEEIASISRKDIELSKQEYKKGIINRVKYFIAHPIEMTKFYIVKTASMWTENTYSAIWYNQTFAFNKTQEEKLQRKWLDEKVIGIREPIILYQKALILILAIGTLLFILKNRNNQTKEVLLLITIFIGGFLFHTLWEAKSRYIIPYILILIPVAAISIENSIFRKKNKDYLGR